MSKKKSKVHNKAKAALETPRVTVNAKPDKNIGHMHSLCKLLGLSNPPKDKTDAMAAALSLHSHWCNGGIADLNKTHNELSTITNHLRVLRLSPNSTLTHKARELVQQLNKKPPRQLGEHPIFREVVTAMNDAIGQG